MICAGVISWDGMHDAASAIASAVSRRLTDLVVVYSNRSERPESGAGSWIRAPDQDFFGRKFRRLLDEVPPGRALLLIQADAACSDWEGLVQRFETVARTRRDIGLWSPDIDNTAFPTDLGALRPDGDGLWEVVQTDGVVLGVAAGVVDGLRRLDYARNNLGWGIDWAAIGHCRSHGLKTVRDLTLRVHHPTLRGYDPAPAQAQMIEFLAQLPPPQAAVVSDAMAFLATRTERKKRVMPADATEMENIFVMNMSKHEFDDAILGHVSALAVHGGEIVISLRDPSVGLFVVQGAGKTRTPAPRQSSPISRVLDFVRSPDRTVTTELASGWSWSCPGQSTLQMTFSRGHGPRCAPLTEPVDLPPRCGDMFLRLGVAAHRGNFEVLVQIADVHDSSGTEEVRTAIDLKYSGLRETNDYQKIDIAIPDDERHREARILLRYLGGEEAHEEPALVLASRPLLVGAAGAGLASSPLVFVSDDHRAGVTPEFVLTIEPSEDEVSLELGDRSYRLIAARQDGTQLRYDGERVLASADFPTAAALYVDGRAIGALWVGPEPVSLDVEPEVVGGDDVAVELRDMSGSVVKARLKVPCAAIVRRVEARHPDAAVIGAFFDADFYLSGFPEGARPADPASHYLAEGWRVGRDPAPWFSTWHYLAMHPDVARCGMNPFLHYCVAGRDEGRALPRLGRMDEGDVYGAHAYAVAPGPHFEEFDPAIGVGRRKRAKVLAYYLPQFHPVEVNDRQWGKGFTEWRQLPRGMPRFPGHIQPRIPRDLGCYSLAEGDAMRRQIEMARAAGLFGFCFYHYWFDGRRVLEAPMERLLADPTLDFPFCLMWANENWTRTWDGSEREVILAQSYRAEDEAPFIDDLARHMKDPRYIRVGGRPLFFVYRPGHIPNARASLARWRALFRDRHGLDPLIFQAQAFGDNDPRVFDLDGAIEFPPHKIGDRTPNIASSIGLMDKSFSGDIRDYGKVVQLACSEPQPHFPLIRTVFPSWDNDARRPGRGTIYANSTPQKFAEWLDWAIRCVEARPIEGEKFVCVNAWNEWAEGAYLEPDVHFGGAYLNEVSRVIHGVVQVGAAAQRSKVLLVGHDVLAFGAQTLLTRIGERLSQGFGTQIEFLILSSDQHGGAFATTVPAMEAIGRVTFADRSLLDDAALAARYRAEGFVKAITNTTVSGRLVAALKDAGFSVVSLIHELPNLLKSYHLVAEARSVAHHADHVLFPAQVVRDGFESVAGRIAHQAEILPQGLYNTSVLKQPHGDDGLRAELGLDSAARIVLGVGYADLRKGIDRFVAAGLSLTAAHPDIAFLWVGAPSGEASQWFLPEIEASGQGDRVRILGHRDDVARFYAAADAFYLSSREDPFPSVVLEALAAGLPVVGHKGCGGCDALIAEHGALVAANDPLSAARALLEALRAPADRAADARRAEIVRNYDFDAYVFGLLQRLNPDLVAVSAVIPNYNYEAYIGQRLRSVFDQTYPLRDVIVLDDASPDNSLAEIERTVQAAGRTIDLHVNAANTGSPFAQWRKGVELAKGDHVWIAEADDLADPGFVARLIERMQRTGSVLGFTDSRQIDERGEPLGDSYRPYLNEIEPGAFDASFNMDGPEFLARFLAVKNVILNVSAVIVHRKTLLDALDALGDDLYDYSVAGDWRLYAEICVRADSRVTWLSEPLNTHRRHRRSVTHALKAEKHLAEIAAMHRLAREIALPSEEIVLKQRTHYSNAMRYLIGEKPL